MEYKDFTNGLTFKPLSWLAKILELIMGSLFEFHRREGLYETHFTVVHKMPRYLLIYHKISFDVTLNFKSAIFSHEFGAFEQKIFYNRSTKSAAFCALQCMS